MKRFIVNRHGRIVFPFNFFPQLDFSVFDTLAQYEEVIQRDYARKAPTEPEILARIETCAYATRYDLLRELTLHLRNLSRYTLTLYEQRPLRWADVPRRRDDVFLPSLQPCIDPARWTAPLETGYRAAASTTDRYAEDAILALLLDVYCAGKRAAVEPIPLHPTVGARTGTRGARLYCLAHFDPDYPQFGFDDVVDYGHPVAEIEALMRHAMVLRNLFPWHADDVCAIPIEQLRPDDIVVTFQPRNDAVRDFLRRIKRAPIRVPTARPALALRPPREPFAPVEVRKRLAVMPRLEALASCKGEYVCTNEDLVRNTAYNWSRMSAADIRRKTGIEQRVYTDRSLEEMALEAARMALAKSGHTPQEIGAVLFCSCTSTQTMPSIASWIAAQLGMLQTRVACDLLAACAGMVYGVAEAVRLLQESPRAVLVVGAEKFSDKIGTVRTSRMLFGDAAAALVVAPAPADVAPDIEVFQTYASGPPGEVDAIVWPNRRFDNDVTVYGPDVRSLVKRYLRQMLDELRQLPAPDDTTRSLLDAVELIVPHQANKTMVADLAQDAGIPVERLYFNIHRVGNTSAASIPVALHDAIQEGVIDRPTRVFAPGFGAGAVGGYLVMRVDPRAAA